MVGQLQRQEIDMAPASFSLTEMRSHVIDFSNPIVEMHHRFFVKNPADSYNWTAYLDPFTPYVWLGLAVLIVLITPTLTLALRLLNDPNRPEFTLPKSFLFAAGALTFAKPWSITPERYVARVVFIVVVISGAMVFWHWEAMLISFLSVKIVKLPFKNIRQLVENTDLKITVLPGTAYVDSFRYSVDPVWQRAWTERLEPHLDTLPDGREKQISRILSDPQYTLYDNYFSVKAYPEYIDCLIADISTQYDPKAFSYAFAKNSTFLPLFNYYLNLLNEKGATQQIVDRYINSDQQLCADTSGQPLGFPNCFTAFVILVVGIVLSVATFGYEGIKAQSHKIPEACARLTRRARRRQEHSVLSEYEINLLQEIQDLERENLNLKARNAKLESKLKKH